MKKNYFLLLILIVPVFLFCQLEDVWNNLRHSAVTSDNEIHVRCETLAGFTSKFHYLTNEGWIQQDAETFQALTLENIIPYDSENTTLCRYTSEIDLEFEGISAGFFGMGALLSDDEFPQSIIKYAETGTDSLGDVEIEDSPHLDITNQYFGFSEEKYYACLETAEGDFPFTEGFFGPFNVYIFPMVDPINVLQDSIAYAMVYANIPLFLTSGLYRIGWNPDNPLESFEQIGDIEAEVINNNLYLSCNEADIVADSENWIEDINMFAALPFIIQVALDMDLNPEIAFADYGVPMFVQLDQHVIEPFTNELPTISEFNYEFPVISCVYNDSNGNFPLTANVTIGEDIFDLSTMNPDFSDQVTFEKILVNPLSVGDEAVFNFSDNNIDFVTETFVDNNDIYTQENFSIKTYPNPFAVNNSDKRTKQEIKISFDLKKSDNVSFDIFDLLGRKIYEENPEYLKAGKQEISWNIRTDEGKKVSSGIYFLKLKYGNNEKIKKLVIFE